MATLLVFQHLQNGSHKINTDSAVSKAIPRTPAAPLLLLIENSSKLYLCEFVAL